MYFAIAFAIGLATGWFGHMFLDSDEPAPSRPSGPDNRAELEDLKRQLSAAREEISDLNAKKAMWAALQDDQVKVPSARQDAPTEPFDDEEDVATLQANEVFLDGAFNDEEDDTLGDHLEPDSQVPAADEPETQEAITLEPVGDAAEPDEAPAEEESAADGTPGFLLSEAPAAPDSLKSLKGLGPATERTLNELGIYTFAQIAGMTDADLDWLTEQNAKVGARARKDDWVGQAAGRS